MKPVAALKQEASAKFLSEEGIVHEAWAPFAEGHHDIFRNPVIASIGAKYGNTITGQNTISQMIIFAMNPL